MRKQGEISGTWLNFDETDKNDSEELKKNWKKSEKSFF